MIATVFDPRTQDLSMVSNFVHHVQYVEYSGSDYLAKISQKIVFYSISIPYSTFPQQIFPNKHGAFFGTLLYYLHKGCLIKT